MADSIEAPVRKRQHRSMGNSDPTSPGSAVFGSPFSSNPQTRGWKVHEGNVATTYLGQVESGPPGACAYLQKSQAWAQCQELRNLKCLNASGPARGPIIATANMAFD